MDVKKVWRMEEESEKRMGRKKISGAGNSHMTSVT